MFSLIKKLAVAFSSATLLLGGFGASASIVINTTRVIINEGNREAVSQLDNKGAAPLLVQIWIDEGDANADPSTIHVPFSVTPPVARVDPGKGQAIRILAVNPNLPSDRESLFWLNVVSIPPVPASASTPGSTAVAPKNFIQVAIRTRIKLFYRPDALSTSPYDAYETLSFALNGADGAKRTYGITVKNPSPYFITFNKLELQMPGRDSVVATETATIPATAFSTAFSTIPIPINTTESRMLAPFSEMTIPIPALKTAPPAGTRVSYAVVNDTGGTTHQEKVLEHP